MLSKLRSRLTYANTVASIALFIALGGTSYGLASGSIGSNEIKNNSLRSQDLRNNDIRGRDIRDATIDSRDVQDGALLAKDFKIGQLPGGARGPQGDRGAQGQQGQPGQDATKLFAYIRDFGDADTATVDYGSGVTAVTELSTAGHYTVTFNRSLVNCVVLAAQGIGNPTTGSAATIGPAHPDVQVGSPSANQASITFYNGANAVADTAFMITALC
ncbi:MAG: hypothetical protein V7607_2509 [Solirubrobacteraceae bacterium]